MSARTAVNLTLPSSLVVRAKKLGINLSRAAEAGVEQALSVAERPGFRFGLLAGKVKPPPLEMFAPMSEQELEEWE